jgi:DNA polymerase
MVLGMTLGLPGSLAELSAVFGLGEDKGKMSVGKLLIWYFCKPCKPTKSNGGRVRNMPLDDLEKWSTFVEYNRRDVEVERLLRKKMWPWLPGKEEKKLWDLDQRINDRGVYIDSTLVNNAIQIDYWHQQELAARAKELTGLPNPGSGAQLKQWIREKEGFFPESLTKTTIPEIREQAKCDDVKEMLDLKLLMSRTSIKKYEAMRVAECKDGRVHGLLQFYGAGRTGRWAGRLVQVQNLPRCYLEDLDDARWMLHTGDRELLEAFYDDVPDVLSQLIRTAFTAEPCSNRLLDADFSAIEARVIAWLADEGWRQQVFRENGDIYCASASAMFKVPVVKHGVNGELRQKGKIAELALGYQGGVGALKAMGADKMGLSDEELADIVERWRKASPRIVRLWYEVQDAAMKAINDRTAVTIRHGIKFICEHGLLFIKLPSGRRIAYAKPRIGENRFGGASITYEGMDQIKRKWVRLETYGGKLVENIVQATARDCLGYAMLALDRAGYPIVMHIHDEVVMDVPNEKGSLDDICRIMSEPIPWAPGLILNADGFESPYFRKD